LYADSARRGTTAAGPAVAPEEIGRKYQAFLATNGLISMPSSGLREWWKGVRSVNVFGVLLTALLLSLGAPFWYSALGGLLRLRSVLAGKDDAQRAGRQLTEASSTTAPPTFGAVGRSDFMRAATTGDEQPRRSVS
jgi:hypothetical protein